MENSWEMRISDHLTWLLRNLYAGQEATVKSGHGTMDWLHILGNDHVKAVGCHPATGTLMHTAAAAKSLQSCPTLCNPTDGSPPGSTVPGILQARILEWVAISFSNAWKVKVKLLSRVRLFATPWTAAYQAPLSMGFSRQECWSGLPVPSPICTLHPEKCWAGWNTS